MSEEAGPWLALRVRVHETRKDRAADFFLGLGAVGLNEEHPGLVFEDGEGPLVSGDAGEWTPPPPPPPDAHVLLTAWFEPGTEPAPLRDAARRRLAELGEAQAEPEAVLVPDQDWNRSWMDQYGPVRVGERLWIVPTWREVPAEAESGVVLRLDPGVAFGTGTHTTTACCLRALESDPPTGGSVLDVGTGTGVLAIAALKLGAARAVGVDPDRFAVLAARENAGANGVGDLLEVHPGSTPQAPPGPYDLVFANLLAPLLVRLAAELAERVAPRGRLLASGLLNEQADRVIEAFAAQGLRVRERWDESGWTTLRLERS